MLKLYSKIQQLFAGLPAAFVNTSVSSPKKFKRHKQIQIIQLERDIASSIWALRGIIQLLVNFTKLKIVVRLLWMNL